MLYHIFAKDGSMKLMRSLFAVILLLIPGLMFGQSSGSNKVCNQNAIQDAATATVQLVAAPTVTTTIFINGVGTQVIQQAVHICHVQFRVVQTGYCGQLRPCCWHRY
jgi:hypothetical protein